ncbi:AAA family ATPase [Candidatus Pacearchaeota archaeon]|nr:AAA family ATPase [Candidatus Pacearchaeota archaeon]
MSWDQTIEWFQNNQIASGGMIVVFGGYLLTIGRHLPLIVWNFLLRQFTVVMEIRNNDEAFFWVQSWLDEVGHGKNTRRVTVTTKSSSNNCDDDVELVFSPAPGIHWIYYQGQIVMLTRVRQDSQTTSGNAGTMFSSAPPEWFNIRAIGRNQNVLRNLINDIRNSAMTNTLGKIKIYTPDPGYSPNWKMAVTENKKPIESVVLADNIINKTIDDIDEFQHKKDWYNNMGIPYRRGYLLYGPPGNGKSSFVKALAGYFNTDIYCIALSSMSLSDTSLMSLFSQVPEHNILLIEDIDSLMTVSRDKDSQSTSGSLENTLEGMTTNSMAGLLNMIDGAIAPEGRILFMTTNQPHKLDSALVRPGRIDRQFEIGNATHTQARQLFSRLLNIENREQQEHFATSTPPETSMATIQNILMSNLGNPNGAIEAIKQYEPQSYKED